MKKTVIIFVILAIMIGICGCGKTESRNVLFNTDFFDFPFSRASFYEGLDWCERNNTISVDQVRDFDSGKQFEINDGYWNGTVVDTQYNGLGSEYEGLYWDLKHHYDNESKCEEAFMQLTEELQGYCGNPIWTHNNKSNVYLYNGMLIHVLQGTTVIQLMMGYPTDNNRYFN